MAPDAEGREGRSVMVSYAPLGGSHALSFGTSDFPASWPVITFAAAAIILLALVFFSIVALVPRNDGRHAHAPRHAKAETTSAGETRGIVNSIVGDGSVQP